MAPGQRDTRAAVHGPRLGADHMSTSKTTKCAKTVSGLGTKSSRFTEGGTGSTPPPEATATASPAAMYATTAVMPSGRSSEARRRSDAGAAAAEL